MGIFSKEPPHNIVVFRALQLGDLLCSLPALRALRAAFPQARITLVGLPWAKDFARRFSHYLDDYLEFPGWPGLPEREPELARIPVFLKTLQNRKYDLAIQMQGSGVVTNPLVGMFGAQRMAGYYLLGQYCPDPHTFWPYPEGEHEIHVFLKLMEALGIPSQGEQLEFPVSKVEQENFSRFRAEYSLEPGAYVCLHPGARFIGRRWTPAKFARVGDGLAKMGYRIVVTGTAAERELTAAVVQRMRAPAMDAAGLTDLGTLALLVANARLLVSNDTGVSHVAAAFQTPSVILFSVSEPERWQPLNRQIHRAITNSNQASPKEVLAEVEVLLRESTAYAAHPV